MANYHVVPHQEGWIVIGLNDKKVFKTKSDAVQVARKIARAEKKPLIIYSKEWEVLSVNPYSGRFSKGKIMSANVKHTLSNIKVRNSIAKVMFERKGAK